MYNVFMKNTYYLHCAITITVLFLPLLMCYIFPFKSGDNHALKPGATKVYDFCYNCDSTFM